MNEEELRQQIRSIEEQYPNIYISYKGRRLHSPRTFSEKQASLKWNKLVSLLAETITKYKPMSKARRYKKRSIQEEYDGLC